MTPEQPFAGPVPGVPPTTPPVPDPSMPAANPYAQAAPVDPYAGAASQPQPVVDPYAQPMMGAQPMPEAQPAMGAVPMEPMMGAQPMPEAQPAMGAVPMDPAMGAQPMPEAQPAMGAVPIDPMLAAQPAPEPQPMMGAQPMPEAQPVMGAVPMDPAMGAQPMPEAQPMMGAVQMDPAMSVAPTEPTPASAPTEVGPTIMQAPTAQVNNPIAAAPDAMPPAGIAPEPVKKKTKLPLIIGALVGVLAIIGIVVLILSLGGAKDVTILEDIAFFLPDKKGEDSNYALFNEKGEKITDFNFTSAVGPVGGYAAVTNKDSKSGIVNVKGEMTVDFGKYDSIFSRGALYEALKGDSVELITATGKKVTSLGKDDKAAGVADSYFTVVRRSDGKNEIYDIKGKKVDSFETNKELVYHFDDDIVSVGYEGGLIVLNNKEMTIRKKYDASLAYAIYSVSADGSYMVLHTEEEEYADNKYGLIVGDKIYDMPDKCHRVSLQYDYHAKSYQNVAICEDDNFEEYLVHSDGTVDSKTTSGYIYFSENDYLYDDDNGTVTFYAGGQKGKTINKKYASIVESYGYISIHSYDGSDSVTLYDKAGNEVMTVKSATSIDGIDPNDNAVIASYQSGKGHVEYLADKTGKKISGDYYMVSYAGGDYYRVMKNSSEQSYGVMDKTGKLLDSKTYRRIYYNEEHDAVFGVNDYGEYDLLDKDGKVVAELRGDEVYDYNEYIIVELANGGRQFYTFSGNKFHEYGN